MSIFHERRRYVNTRIWDTEQNPDKFPELDDDSDFACNWVKAKRNFGVAFSGGGTRSASATLGQLRGLRHAGLLDQAGYISAVSGGSWASTPFTFLPTDISEERFLGETVPPEELSLDIVNKAPNLSLARAISKTVIADDFIANALKGGDEAYSRAVGNLFLEPFDLDDRSKFFTFHQGALDVILSDNSNALDDHYYLKASDFYKVRENRPYLIVTGTILRPDNIDIKARKLQCEYTPIYTGVRKFFPNAGREDKPIGGGYIQSFAYDSVSPEETSGSGPYRVKLGRRSRYRFTLSDVIGSSGAAPVEHVRRVSHGISLGFPEFRHWPPILTAHTGSVRDEEYAHSDGGHLENLGLMPLLARRVEKIIVFINTKTPFEDGNFTGHLSPLFGRNDHVDTDEDAVKLEVNKVFDSAKLDELIAAFHTCKENEKTLIHADTYYVRANDHYKVPSYAARICWIYNSPVHSWKNAIADIDVKALLKNDEMKRFPNYKTFLENRPNLIDLSIRQVNMLAHLSCWNVIESSHYIRDQLEL